MGCLGLCCAFLLHVFAAPFCLKAAYLVGMFNSTICGTARWSLPRYFEHDIVNGPASRSVEWIRVYVPGPWQPVAEPWDRLRMTQPPIGNGASSTTSTCIGLVTAREAPLWALFPSQSHMHPFTHGSIVTGSPEDINGSAIRAPTLHVQFSLRDHQTSCTLGCPLRRHPRTRMVASSSSFHDIQFDWGE